MLQSRHPKFMYDSDSDDSVITTTSGGSTTDDDIVWVEEDIGDNCVRVRYVKEGEKINTGTLKQQLKHREHFI